MNWENYFTIVSSGYFGSDECYLFDVENSVYVTWDPHKKDYRFAARFQAVRHAQKLMQEKIDQILLGSE